MCCISRGYVFCILPLNTGPYLEQQYRINFIVHQYFSCTIQIREIKKGRHMSIFYQEYIHCSLHKDKVMGISVLTLQK